MGEIEASFESKTKILNRKKPKKKTVTTVIQPKKMITTVKHPTERKKITQRKNGKKKCQINLVWYF